MILFSITKINLKTTTKMQIILIRNDRFGLAINSHCLPMFQYNEREKNKTRYLILLLYSQTVVHSNDVDYTD